jgi:hypothetical protein
MKFEIEADIPEGYEPTGEYRVPGLGEYYLFSDKAALSNLNLLSCAIILRKKIQYRDPVLPADCGKTARFSDNGNVWGEDRIRGYEEGEGISCHWIASDLVRWKFCQTWDQ